MRILRGEFTSSLFQLVNHSSLCRKVHVNPSFIQRKNQAAQPAQPRILSREEQRIQDAKAERSEKRRERIQEASDVVAAFDRPKDIKFKKFKWKNFELSREMVEKIMRDIVDDYEPMGVRGVDITLRDLHNAAMASPAYFQGLKKAYALFSEKLPALQEGVDWPKILSDPTSVKNQDFKAALQALRLPFSGTKNGLLLLSLTSADLVELIVRILQAFGLEHPHSLTPPNVLYAFQKELNHPLPQDLKKKLDFMVEYDGFPGMRLDTEETAVNVRLRIERRYKDQKELDAMYQELRETHFPKNKKFKGARYEWD